MNEATITAADNQPLNENQSLNGTTITTAEARSLSGAEVKTVLVIAGPTAVGKTGIAIKVAQALNTSIISADSRQCYHGLVIGTAQPDEDQLAAVPHYFINEFPVTQPLNAADFEQLSLGYLDQIFKTRDTAVVCGGTGLYIRALCEGLDDMPPVDETIARQVQADFEAQGLTWLQDQVRLLDPVLSEQIDAQNPARLLRALSFRLSTGRSLLDFQSRQHKKRPFRIIKAGLELPREELYQRINERVDIMMQDGFLEEARTFFPQRKLKNLRTVGYNELFDYLEGKIDLETAVTLIKQHTRNYAKRQLTWFRKDPAFNWLRASNDAIVSELLQLL